MPINQPPNLDYEPGPVGASFSRLGPPPREPAGANNASGGQEFDIYRHEVAAELKPVRRRYRLHRKQH